ncbi:hypothetical protein LCGC14_1377520 [marine sediment metagenome]|uniref:Uncharacterized protein n=1 Tax=marine sediment metagenome TaxID=412755 RepID=A0A0F9K3Z3_9ZZZZ
MFTFATNFGYHRRVLGNGIKRESGDYHFTLKRVYSGTVPATVGFCHSCHWQFYFGTPNWG